MALTQERFLLARAQLAAGRTESARLDAERRGWERLRAARPAAA
jgi:hypothetical protein